MTRRIKLFFFFRNLNQDGLENLFGCVMSCSQVVASPISTQFRSGYTTSLINNLTSSNSIYTNCENDASVPLLQNIHELIAQYEKSASNDNGVDSGNRGNMCDIDGLNPEGIDIDPLFTVPDMNFLDSKGMVYESSHICRKLVQKVDCQDCLCTILTVQEDDSLSFKSPSDTFIQIFKSLQNVINDIIPRLCAEKSLKKKILSLLETLRIEKIGCSEHADVIMLNLKELCIHFGIVLFCQNINNILSGKIKSIPPHANNIQVLALDFKKTRKNIGKYSDIFKDNTLLKK